MCSRFSLNAPPEVLARTFNLQEIPDIEPRYNIAPNQFIASVRNRCGQNTLDLLKWGLLSNGEKDNIHAPINACSEAVDDDPSFQHAIRHSRCIVPASGYYEWIPEDNHKQPFYIRLTDSGILGFAGIWERSISKDGIEVETCCILSTVANELVEDIHNRMPVILSPDNYDHWLNGNIQNPEELQRFYQPYPSDLMVAHAVPHLVNNPRFDSPSCILQM